MIPVLSATQVRQWDSATISAQSLSSYELMERAASYLTEAILDRCNPSPQPILVACGPGNNGGDGLAMARLMSIAGLCVEVLILGQRCSPDRQTNLRRLADHPEIRVHIWPDRPDPRRNYHTVVDALLGTGFHGSLKGEMAEAVAFLNNLAANRIAVDMPTGLSADESLQGNAYFKADLTLTIACPKPSLIMAENQPAFGKWEIVEIGLDENYPTSVQPFAQILEERDVHPLLRKPRQFAHKGQNGHALLVCGSTGMMGAAILAGEACLRSGAGKLTVHVPKKGGPIIQAALPEAMAHEDDDPDRWTGTLTLEAHAAIGIGCGIGRRRETGLILESTLDLIDLPLVLDADALFFLADNPALRRRIPSGAILTPHQGEFHRMVGTPRDSFEEIDLLREFCHQHKCIMVLKGAFSRICLPDGSLWINSTGNPGMATAGSGDVLTGMITGFLAQGYHPAEAAGLATYIHGMAGDLALEVVGSTETVIARDIIAQIGNALHRIREIS